MMVLIQNLLLRWNSPLRGRQRADRAAPVQDGAPELYKVRGWPDLPDLYRTAPVYRVLSTMSTRAVNRSWMAWKTGLSDQDLDRLLDHLRDQQQLVTVPPRSSTFCLTNPLETPDGFCS